MFSDGMYMIRLPVFTAPTVPRWYFIQSALRTTFSHRLTLCTFLFSLPFFLLSRSLVVEGTGAVDNDLFKACQKALATRDVKRCVAHAKTFSWSRMADEFLATYDMEDEKSD